MRWSHVVVGIGAMQFICGVHVQFDGSHGLELREPLGEASSDLVLGEAVIHDVDDGWVGELTHSTSHARMLKERVPSGQGLRGVRKQQ